MCEIMKYESMKVVEVCVVEVCVDDDEDYDLFLKEHDYDHFPRLPNIDVWERRMLC